MPFTPFVVSLIKEKSLFCFCCQSAFFTNEYKAVHSATGLHLELVKVPFPVAHFMFRVCDPPADYNSSLGYMYEDMSEFGLPFRMDGDAVCVCYNCHKNIHELALDICRERIPGFKGNTPLPRILANATFNYYVFRPRLAH